MFKTFIIADETEQIRELGSELAQKDFGYSIASNGEEAIEQVIEQAPDLVFIVMNGSPASPVIGHLIQTIKQKMNLPVVALLSRQALDSLDSGMTIDDFVIEPWDAAEVAARARRIMGLNQYTTNSELIKYGDLVIDQASCEVSLKGRLIALTFKEYELLKFLASNRDRVFTREALLNKVWGYDYFGGDRTVDVHIRRLRSKIEDSTHTFIETVRNIGYRFRDAA